jgi:hypothetical protein
LPPSEEDLCGTCRVSKDSQHEVAIPETTRSRFIQNLVNEFLKTRCEAEISVREFKVYEPCSFPECEAEDESEECDCDPEQHIYVCLFAKLDENREVLVMVMDLYENEDNVNLSQLASAPYFEPAALRSALYQEVLLAYFQYLGATERRQVTWAVLPPPSKATCYHFRHLPSDMVFLEEDILRKWYAKLTDKALARNIASEVSEEEVGGTWNVRIILTQASETPVEDEEEQFAKPARLQDFEMKDWFYDEDLSFSDLRKAVYATRALVKFVRESL